MTAATHKIRQMLEDAERKEAAARERADRALRDAERYAIEADAFRRTLHALGEADAFEDMEVGLPTPGDKWMGIYAQLVKRARSPYEYNDIQWAAQDLGHDVTQGSLRTQMMNAVKSGLFKRMEPGKFALTDEGRRLLEVLPQKNEPPSGGSSGEAGTSPGVAERDGDGDPPGVDVYS